MCHNILTWFKNLFKETQELLPTSEAALGVFLAKVIDSYGLPAGADTEEVICGLILHMPPSVDRAPLSFIAGSVNKSLANKAVYTKLQAFDQARRDARAAAESEELAAKTALEIVANPPADTPNLVPADEQPLPNTQVQEATS